MNTTTLTFLIVVCIGLGALFLLAASIISAKISKVVPHTLRNKWFTLLALIVFFIASYIFFLFSFLFNLPISTAFLSGIIFLAGAVFVLLVINLAKTTIFKMFEDDNELRVLNEQLKNYSVTLDTKVKDRTAELNQIFDSAADGMRIIDLDFTVIKANRTFLKMSNHQDTDVVGTKCYETFKGDRCDTPQCPLKQILAGAERVECETFKKTTDMQELFCILTATPFRDSKRNIIGIVEDFKDITERKQAETEREKLIVKLQEALDEIRIYQAQLKEMALFDPLTRLPNRRLFFDRLNMTLEHNRRSKGIFSVLYLDLDDFKIVNDSLGHEAGDELLCAVTELLKKVIRKPDTIARLGGDEFAIIIDQLKSAKDAEKVAEKLIASLATSIQLKTGSVNVGVSIGISLFPVDSHEAEELVRLADKSMYISKSRGKNTYTYFCEDANS